MQWNSVWFLRRIATSFCDSLAYMLQIKSIFPIKCKIYTTVHVKIVPGSFMAIVCFRNIIMWILIHKVFVEFIVYLDIESFRQFYLCFH